MPLTREQDRERKRLLRQDPAFRARENAKAAARMRRLRQDPAVLDREREYRRAHPQPARFHTMPAPVPKPRVPRVKAEKPRVPAEVREAWRKAHPNSAIRRLYPTPKALERWAA